VVLKTDPSVLRSAGLSGSKAAAIQDLAGKVLGQAIPTRQQTHSMADEEIIEALTQVRGVGRWTVEMFLIFTLGRPDVFPIHDFGVRKGFACIFNKRELPSPKRLGELGRRWNPYRSALAWYCWRALEIPQYQLKFRTKNE
jgi:3-methyladenine DNA glycosylase/8-oxoguanine DNA glycosylase